MVWLTAAKALRLIATRRQAGIHNVYEMHITFVHKLFLLPNTKKMPKKHLSRRRTQPKPTHLYRLRVRNSATRKRHCIGWDKYETFIVRAHSATHARRMTHNADANASYWLNTKETTCELLKESGAVEVVCAAAEWAD